MPSPSAPTPKAKEPVSFAAKTSWVAFACRANHPNTTIFQLAQCNARFVTWINGTLSAAPQATLRAVPVRLTDLSPWHDQCVHTCRIRRYVNMPPDYADRSPIQYQKKGVCSFPVFYPKSDSSYFRPSLTFRNDALMDGTFRLYRPVFCAAHTEYDAVLLCRNVANNGCRRSSSRPLAPCQ